MGDKLNGAAVVGSVLLSRGAIRNVMEIASRIARGSFGQGSALCVSELYGGQNPEIMGKPGMTRCCT